jgi:aspartyl aminopeptidase
LGVGGRIIVKNENGIQNLIYTSSKPIAVISSMCIHLKDSNPLDINKETDLRPIIGSELIAQLNGVDKAKESPLIKFICDELKIESKSIVGFDLCLADF